MTRLRRPPAAGGQIDRMNLDATHHRGSGGILLSATRALFGRRQGLPPIAPEELRRVLLIRYDRLGDAIITTPLLQTLTDLAPHVEIDVLAGEGNRAIFEKDPRVRSVEIWNGAMSDLPSLIGRTRARRYDIIYQLILNRTTLPSILAGLMAPRGRTVGKLVEGHEALLNHAAPLESSLHFRDRTLALLAGGLALKGPLTAHRYSVHLPDDEKALGEEAVAEAGLQRGRFILLNISSASPKRELPGPVNIELARRMRSTGYDVAIVAGPGREEQGRRIAKAAGAMPLLFPTLHAMIAGVGLAHIVVTPDTAFVHIASAMGAPVVALYTRDGDIVGWGPRDVPFRTVQATTGDSLGGIGVDEIMRGVEGLMGEIE